MKFIEEGRKLKTKLHDYNIMCMCPSDLKLEDYSICPIGGCIPCWNREIPITTPTKK